MLGGGAAGLTDRGGNRARWRQETSRHMKPLSSDYEAVCGKAMYLLPRQLVFITAIRSLKINIPTSNSAHIQL